MRFHADVAGLRDCRGRLPGAFARAAVDRRQAAVPKCAGQRGSLLPAGGVESHAGGPANRTPIAAADAAVADQKHVER